MKFLFDQNISHKILNFLPDEFRKSTHIKNEGLINASDKMIWEYAKLNEFTIVTLDSDFDDLNSLFGFPPKIIWLRVGNTSTNELVRILSENIREIKLFLENADAGCLEIFN